LDGTPWLGKFAAPKTASSHEQRVRRIREGCESEGCECAVWARPARRGCNGPAS